MGIRQQKRICIKLSLYVGVCGGVKIPTDFQSVLSKALDCEKPTRCPRNSFTGAYDPLTEFLMLLYSHFKSSIGNLRQRYIPYLSRDYVLQVWVFVGWEWIFDKN